MILFFVSDIEQNIMVFLKFTKKDRDKTFKNETEKCGKIRRPTTKQKLEGARKNGESSTLLLPYALVRTNNHIVCV